MNNNHFLTKCQEIFSFKVKFYLLLVEKKESAMMKLPISIKIYLGMVIVLSLLAALNVFFPKRMFFFPKGKFLLESQLPVSKSVIALMTTEFFTAVWDLSE